MHEVVCLHCEEIPRLRPSLPNSGVMIPLLQNESAYLLAVMGRVANPPLFRNRCTPQGNRR